MLLCNWASIVAQAIKNPPAMQETWVGKIPWNTYNTDINKKIVHLLTFEIEQKLEDKTNQAYSLFFIYVID